MYSLLHTSMKLLCSASNLVITELNNYSVDIPSWCLSCSVIRLSACRAFWCFANHFRAEAESLLSSLDSTKQKQLLGEQPSNSSSNTSINSVGRGGGRAPAPGTGSKTARPLSKGPRSGYHAVESSGIDVLLYFYIVVALIHDSCFAVLSCFCAETFLLFSFLVCF